MLNDSPDKVVRVWCCGCSSGEEVCQSAREHARTLRSTPYTAHAAQHTVCQRCACPEIDTQTTRDVAAETFCPVVESALRDAPLTSTRATAVAYNIFPHAPHRCIPSVSCGRSYWRSTSVRMLLSKFWALMCLLLRLTRAAMPGTYTTCKYVKLIYTYTQTNIHHRKYTRCIYIHSDPHIPSYIHIRRPSI